MANWKDKWEFGWRTLPSTNGYLINENGEVITRNGIQITPRKRGKNEDCFSLVSNDKRLTTRSRKALLKEALEFGKKAIHPDIKKAKKGYVRIEDTNVWIHPTNGMYWSARGPRRIKKDKHGSYRIPINEKPINVDNIFMEMFGYSFTGRPEQKNEREKQAIEEQHIKEEFVPVKRKERVCHKCGKPSKGQYYCDKCRGYKVSEVDW